MTKPLLGELAKVLDDQLRDLSELRRQRHEFRERIIAMDEEEIDLLVGIERTKTEIARRKAEVYWQL